MYASFDLFSINKNSTYNTCYLSSTGEIRSGKYNDNDKYNYDDSWSDIDGNYESECFGCVVPIVRINENTYTSGKDEIGRWSLCTSNENNISEENNNGTSNKTNIDYKSNNSLNDLSSMKEIESVSIYAMYEGGNHRSYNVEEEDIKSLEEVIDTITEKQISSDDENHYGDNIAMWIYCKDGTVYCYTLGKGKVYRRETYNGNTMLKINATVEGDAFYNWIEKVIQKASSTDSTIARDWAN